MSPWRIGTWRSFDRALVVVLVFGFLVFGVGGVWEHSRTDRLIEQGAEAHDAICALRGDISNRVKAGLAFLEKHPQGFAGVDADTIRSSLATQQHTVDALGGIPCPKGAP